LIGSILGFADRKVTSDCADEVTLVSQRRKEPNTRPQASFDRNEDEYAR
jgi:hypothetical protein